jgi:hypothetical protein
MQFLNKRTLFNVSLEEFSDLSHKSNRIIQFGKRELPKFVANLKKFRKQLNGLRNRMI